MAAVQPHAAPRRHPPPVSAPSQAAQLPCKRGRADAVAVAHGGKQERVAESCCPSERDDQELELVLVDDDSGEEDGGCGSFVGGGGGGGGGGQDDEDEVEGSGSVVVWWRRQESNCSLWANGSRVAGGEPRGGGDEDEDPKAAGGGPQVLGGVPGVGLPLTRKAESSGTARSDQRPRLLQSSCSVQLQPHGTEMLRQRHRN